MDKDGKKSKGSGLFDLRGADVMLSGCHVHPEPMKLAGCSDCFAKYDAWSRMVSLVDPASDEAVQQNEYDARTFRTTSNSYASGSLSQIRHLFYSAAWQAIEERLGTTPDTAVAERHQVWGGRYVDDIVMRERDTTGTGTLNERLYALSDTNWNVVAMCDSDAVVEERYLFSAFGSPTFLNATMDSVRTSSQIESELLFTGQRFDATTGLYLFRRRFFNPVIGSFQTHDGVLYHDGSNLYAAWFVPNEVDPDGNLRISRSHSQSKNSFDSLLGKLPRGSTPFVKWDVYFDSTVATSQGSKKGAPCDGYLVQKVDVVCLSVACNCKTRDQGIFTYWEAWQVKRGDSATVQSTGADYADNADYSPFNPSIGLYSQYGTFRFYCIHDISFNGILPGQWATQTKYPINNTKGDCATGAGSLLSTGDRPDFWTEIPMYQENEVTRKFEVSWNCCERNTNSNCITASATP